MKTAGSLIALVGSFVSVFAGLLTLYFGGFVDAFLSDSLGPNKGYTVLIISIIVVLLSILSFFNKSKYIPILLIISSIFGFLLGGRLVAIFMAMCIIGSILAFIHNSQPKRRADDKAEVESYASLRTSGSKIYKKWWSWALILVVALFFVSNLVSRRKDNESSIKEGIKINDTALMELNGNIRLLRETTHYAADRFGKVMPDKFISSRKIIFNDRGNIAETIDYTSDGFFNYKTEYKYDDKYNKIEVKELILDAFYSDGRYITRASEKYEYDKNGYCTAINFYDQSKALKTKYIFTNDAKGNNIETRIYNAQGILTQGWMSVYDANNNKQEESVFDSDGNIINKHVFTYFPDKLSKLHKTTSRLKGEKIYNANNVLTSTTSYCYSERGHVSGMDYTFENGSIERWTYVYEYNKNNNWVKKIEFKNGVAINILERNFNKELPPSLSNISEVNIVPDKIVIEKEKPVAQKPVANTQNVYNVVFDNVRIRENPSLDGNSIGTLYSSDKVVFLNEKSDNKDTVTMKKKSYTSNWYKIKTSDNVEGWIFGAAIGK